MSDNIFTLFIYSTAILVILALAVIVGSVSARVNVRKSERWVIETRRWVVADTSLLRAFVRLVTKG